MADRVNFDHAAAKAVVAAMRDAVTKMQGYKRVEDPLRADALKGWKGTYGDRFRSDAGRGEPWITGEHLRLVGALNSTANAIEEAGEDADKLNAQQS
jgi:hypothetical protein